MRQQERLILEVADRLAGEGLSECGLADVMLGGLEISRPGWDIGCRVRLKNCFITSSLPVNRRPRGRCAGYWRPTGKRKPKKFLDKLSRNILAIQLL
jgi:hypothetical protein